MSRTYRRQQLRGQWQWWSVLEDWNTGKTCNPRSRSGKKALADFHSDHGSTPRGGSAPAWLRKSFDHQLRTLNDRMLRHCVLDAEFDPQFQARHRQTANWRWW